MMGGVIFPSRLVTIHNDVPRYDVNGDLVDAHDGMILAVNGSYFLYGEFYNKTTGNYPWAGGYPKLSVYTSPDLLAWTFRAPLLLGGQEGWIPNVFYDPQRQRFVCWYGVGDWGVATSPDGITFTVVHNHTSSRLGGQTDGTGIFIDEDGVGYVIFAALVEEPGTRGHLVSIERMASDYLSSSKVNVSAFFPDGLVESPALFKHGGTYFATYGSCCCACRQGGGIVVFSAPSVAGPWTRQAPWGDINCKHPTQICRETGDFTINAQWWGASLIPTATGDTAIIFTGRRWLSGAGNPAACSSLCGGDPSCLSPGYLLRSDFDVWVPLAFNGSIILPLQQTPSFTLDLP